MSMRETTKRALAKLGILRPVTRVVSFARSHTRNSAHKMREIAYRVPRPLDRRSAAAADLSEHARRLADVLADKGIVVLPDFLRRESLAAAQVAFAAMVARIESAPNGPEKISPPGYLPQTSYLEDERNKEA